MRAPSIVAKVPAECVIGVDLGGTNLVAGAVDAQLGVHHRARRDGRRPRPAGAARHDRRRRRARSRDAVGGDVDAVGFGIPCLIDDERGLAASSVHLPIARLAVRRGDGGAHRPADFVDNDANLALLAEHRHGAARGERVAVMLTLGTGVGGAILIGGELFRGAQGAAGELGHMVARRRTGPTAGPAARAAAASRRSSPAPRSRARPARPRGASRRARLGRALAADGRSPARSSPSSRTTATPARSAC